GRRCATTAGPCRSPCGPRRDAMSRASRNPSVKSTSKNHNTRDSSAHKRTAVRRGSNREGAMHTATATPTRTRSTKTPAGSYDPNPRRRDLEQRARELAALYVPWTTKVTALLAAAHQALVDPTGPGAARALLELHRDLGSGSPELEQYQAHTIERMAILA